MVDTLSKPAWRVSLLSARDAVAPSTLSAEALAFARWVSTLTGTVCAYRPVGSEPGSTLLLPALLDAGCRVLLPIVVRGQPLDWAPYDGPSCLAPAAYGLLEPVGPRLGPTAVLTADTVLVPALAVDRTGVRLGRGGGYYDRSLAPLATSGSASGSASAGGERDGRGTAGPRLVAVVRDEELVDTLPREAHDVLMSAALTPSAGFTPLG